MEKEPLQIGFKSEKEARTPYEFLPPVDPGFGVLALFYLLGLLFNAFVVIVAVASTFADNLIPPNIQKYLRWRWAAVALVTVGTFALLLLQDAAGFGLERQAADQLRKLDDSQKELKSGKNFKEQAIARGIFQQSIIRAGWFRLAFWLHFWAVIFVFITMLAHLRSPRPSPRVDLLW